MHRRQGLRVAFLTRYDRSRASSRVRAYDYLPHLQEMGWICRVLPSPNHLSSALKTKYVLQCLWLARWADVVILQKLLLPQTFVDVLKRLNSALVFDFDDALYALPDRVSSEQQAQRYRIREQRLQYILREVRCVVAGSEYLARYAKQFVASVYILPSSVDTKRYSLKKKTASDKVILGWIGSSENLVDFQPIRSRLREVLLQLGDEAALKIVSTQSLPIEDVQVQFERWTPDRDTQFLHSFDIGLMPLNDTERSRGRCAFKAIQYMAVGLPVIASPVGAATEVIEHGKTGYLASTPEEWATHMIELGKDEKLRIRLGQAGRTRVQQRYSIRANAPILTEILEEAMIK